MQELIIQSLASDASYYLYAKLAVGHVFEDLEQFPLCWDSAVFIVADYRCLKVHFELKRA